MLRGKTFLFVLLVLLISCSSCLASEIHLRDEEILLNGIVLSGENEEGIIYSNAMNNGSNTLDGKKENIEIDNVITITKPGEYIFEGSLSNGQIAVDANNINGDVKITLNNVSINCDDAPAIFVFSKDIENDKCNVTISTTKDSLNEISGGKLKVSVENWTDQDDILYYVEKGYDDDNKYFERYKYDGAISSDISLNFDGEGVLNVIGKEKEGIESKMNITINGGSLIIKSIDDAINASADGKSIITINNGKVIAYLMEEAEEGDGIDSNGKIYINGGKVYSFACPGSDSGLDADGGTYINGGLVLSTGSMNDKVTFSSNINSAKATFNKEINNGDVICVVSEDGDIMFAYKTDRKINNFIYTSPELEVGKNYLVYTNAVVSGNTNEWGIYTNIDSFDLTNAEKNDFNEMQRPDFTNKLYSEKNKVPTIAGIIALIASGVLFIIVLLVDINDKDMNAKLKIINLIFGILIGMFLAFGILVLSNNETEVSRGVMRPMELEEFNNTMQPDNRKPGNARDI